MLNYLDSYWLYAILQKHAFFLLNGTTQNFRSMRSPKRLLFKILQNEEEIVFLYFAPSQRHSIK